MLTQNSSMPSGTNSAIHLFFKINGCDKEVVLLKKKKIKFDATSSDPYSKPTICAKFKALAAKLTKK